MRGKTYLRLLPGVLLALLLAACSGGSGSGSGGSGSPAPDFTIDLSDKNLTMQQFGIAYTDLTLTPQHGFSGTVELRLRSRSSGEIVFTVSPNRLEVSGGSPLRWTLEILTGGSPPDVYPLTLEASTPSGSPLRTVDLTLTVTPPGPALP